MSHDKGQVQKVQKEFNSAVQVTITHPSPLLSFTDLLKGYSTHDLAFLSPPVQFAR